MNKKPFQWAIVGAGPAGIAALGRLIDSGIAPDNILWLDPHFKVGDLGLFWRNVSSNTSVEKFLAFLQASPAFRYSQSSVDFLLNHHNPEDTCVLSDIVEPLQWVSDHLYQQVNSKHGLVHGLTLKERIWHLSSGSELFKAENVILATGSLPSALNYPGVDVISFDKAIDKERLAATIDVEKTYGVFGSSHSAIIIVRHLVELGVKKIINFYRSPCRYALDMGEWILFDNTGLKGQTAQWARENIDGTLPLNLVRYTINDHSITNYLPECDQVIYAVGFEQRKNLIIGDYEHANYNPHVGIIGPGLFGLGIAYPEIKPDNLGSVEKQVGLWKFMVYLNKVLPIWLRYHA